MNLPFNQSIILFTDIYIDIMFDWHDQHDFSVLFAVLVLIIMMFSPVQCDKEAVNIVTPEEHYVEQTYLLYVPQLVTVRYPLSHNTKVLIEQNGPRALPKKYKDGDVTSSGKKVIVLKSKKMKEQDSSKKLARKGKINIMSGRVNRKGSTNQTNDQTNSSFCHYSERKTMPEQPNHIHATNILDTMACDFFQCNGLQQIDEFQRIPQRWPESQSFDLDRSTSTIEKKIDFTQPTHQLDSFSRNGSHSFEESSVNQSLGCFSKRKNIFSKNNRLNTTIGGYPLAQSRQNSRSSSRKPIFPKKSNFSMSFSQEKSFEGRRRIFEKKDLCVSPKFGVKKSEQNLHSTDIPPMILDNWEKWSQSEASLDQCGLRPVQECGLEDSPFRAC